MKSYESRQSFSRRLLLAIGVWFAVVAVMCAPFRHSVVSAIPENLWTREQDFSWHSPISSLAVLPFQRTEHVLGWHFLVVDRGQGHTHWSARVEPRALFAYAFIASLVSGLFYFARRHAIHRTV